jgi:hypothetical protein
LRQSRLQLRTPKSENDPAKTQSGNRRAGGTRRS